MAVKGAVAKAAVVKRLQEAFGEDFIGEIDKKIYVWSKEDGERVQVCLALTCPKTPVEAKPKPNLTGRLDFEEMDAVAPATKIPEPSAAAEVSEDEIATLTRLLKELGL